MSENKKKPVRAWHFLNGDTLRDGTKATADGEWLEFNGKLEMCESGLHFSRLPHQYAADAEFDALVYESFAEFL